MRCKLENFLGVPAASFWHFAGSLPIFWHVIILLRLWCRWEVSVVQLVRFLRLLQVHLDSSLLILSCWLGMDIRSLEKLAQKRQVWLLETCVIRPLQSSTAWWWCPIHITWWWLFSAFTTFCFCNQQLAWSLFGCGGLVLDEKVNDSSGRRRSRLWYCLLGLDLLVGDGSWRFRDIFKGDFIILIWRLSIFHLGLRGHAILAILPLLRLSLWFKVILIVRATDRTFDVQLFRHEHSPGLCLLRWLQSTTCYLGWSSHLIEAELKGLRLLVSKRSEVAIGMLLIKPSFRSRARQQLIDLHWVEVLCTLVKD